MGGFVRGGVPALVSRRAWKLLDAASAHARIHPRQDAMETKGEPQAAPDEVHPELWARHEDLMQKHDETSQRARHDHPHKIRG